MELKISEAVGRIQQKEMIFDILTKCANETPKRLIEPCMQEITDILSKYMAEGKWLEDYEMDEKGLLPTNLKKGVLSQDSLYELLCKVRELKK